MTEGSLSDHTSLDSSLSTDLAYLAIINSDLENLAASVTDLVGSDNASSDTLDMTHNITSFNMMSDKLLSNYDNISEDPLVNFTMPADMVFGQVGFKQLFQKHY